MIDTKIEQVATGLGLTAIGLDRPIEQMSGGQRAKVILAKLLLEKPDILLLDEPTNFLDKEHVTWLAEYLSSLPNAFLVVSHDYDFLERISTRICDIDNEKIQNILALIQSSREKRHCSVRIISDSMPHSRKQSKRRKNLSAGILQGESQKWLVAGRNSLTEWIRWKLWSRKKSSRIFGLWLSR